MKNTDKKVVKKSTKKVAKKAVEVKPKYIYDITHCETESDVLYMIGACNMIYGLPVTEDMNMALIAGCKDDILSLAGVLFDGDILVRCGDVFTEPKIVKKVTINKDEELTVTKKKPNIFKRFWNWITRKK